LKSGRLLKETHVIAIALIPKALNPSYLKDFRSIFCCNTIYKGIAKILANRIKPLLPRLVGVQQTAFVEGRKIANNILLAQELPWNYHQNQGMPWCALRVDLRRLVILFDGIFS
jgi:hypothetical protein